MEHLGSEVAQRDVEIPGRHQLADDGVDRAIQLVQAGGGLGRLGDAIDGGLHLLGPFALYNLGLQGLVGLHQFHRALLDPHL